MIFCPERRSTVLSAPRMIRALGDPREKAAGLTGRPGGTVQDPIIVGDVSFAGQTHDLQDGSDRARTRDEHGSDSLAATAARTLSKASLR